MVVLEDILPKLVKFGNCFIILLGILFCMNGICGIVLSIIELTHGRPKMCHYDESQGCLTVENPLWPSTGKGFWVGLIMLSTGLVGVLSSRERSKASYNGFTVLSGISTILSFYLLITCIIPVHYDTKYSDTSRPNWQSIELTINSLLIGVGGVGIIIGSVSTLVGSTYAECWNDQRNEHSDIYSSDTERIL